MSRLLSRKLWLLCSAALFPVIATGCARSTLPAVETSIGVAAAGSASSELGSEWRDTDRAWQAARKAHPLHFQAVFAAPRTDGRTTVVITEPPPPTRVDDIRKLLGADLVATRDWAIGFDGRLRDIVAIVNVDAGNGGESLLRERLASLHEYLFHSTYRAKVYDPFQPSEAHPSLDLDLAVPVGAIRDWVKSSKRHFVGLNGERVGSEAFNSNSTHGVFRAEDVGISLWVIPNKTDLCSVLPEMRNFALETDLLLGGMRTPAGTALVGRSRVTSLEQMPPLRSEVLLALTAADQGELSQSYQRFNFFAGKLRDNKDWAPILLSPDLVDNEFGGLLNITDQLLKGWSLNGIVSYEKFAYPKPSKWASDRKLSDELGVMSLTFNWNTSGATTGVEYDDALTLVNSRTGALPIAYLPEGIAEGSGEVAAFEDRNQNFFATQNDANLTRVVAYTTFYQLASAFQLHAGPACQATRSAPAASERSKAQVYLEDLLRAIIEQRAAPRLDTQQDDSAKQAVAELGRVSREIEEEFGPSGKDELIHYLAGVDGYQSVADPHPDIRDFAGKLAAQTASWAMSGYFDKLFDRDGVMADYAKLAKSRPESYIRTPSIVVSNVPDEKRVVDIDGKPEEVTVRSSGGHNIRNVPGILRVDASATGSRVSSALPFEFNATVPERDLWIDPKVMQRIQKAVQDKRMSPESARSALDLAALNPVKSPQLPLPPKGDPGVGFDIPRPSQAAQAFAGKPGFAVQFVGKGDAMFRGFSPEGRVLEGGTTRGMLDALAADMQMRRRAGEPLLLELSGFSELRAKNFVAEVLQRRSVDLDPGRVVFVAKQPNIVSKFRGWLDRFRGNSRIEVQLAPGDAALPSYLVRLPDGQGGLLVRVHHRIAAALRATLAPKLRAMFRSSEQRSLVQRLEEFCAADKIDLEVSLDRFGPPNAHQSELDPPARPNRNAARAAANLVRDSGALRPGLSND